MSLPKNNFKVGSQFDSDGDGRWIIFNEKEDGLTTTEDYEGIEDDLQKIADTINQFDGVLRVETALELTLHCNEQLAKMECDHWKERSQKLVAALESIRDGYDHDVDAHRRGHEHLCRVCIAKKALNEYNQ